jgi:hypothetical protein
MATRDDWPAKEQWEHVWSARSQPQRTWNPKQSIGRSLRNMPQWNLLEDCRSGIGARIWPQRATWSRKNIPGEIVDLGRNWPQPAEQWPTPRVAQCKENVRKNRTRDNMVWGILKRLMFGRRGVSQNCNAKMG